MFFFALFKFAVQKRIKDFDCACFCLCSMPNSSEANDQLMKMIPSGNFSELIGPCFQLTRKYVEIIVNALVLAIIWKKGKILKPIFPLSTIAGVETSLSVTEANNKSNESVETTEAKTEKNETLTEEIKISSVTMEAITEAVETSSKSNFTKEAKVQTTESNTKANETINEEIETSTKTNVSNIEINEAIKNNSGTNTKLNNLNNTIDQNKENTEKVRLGTKEVLSSTEAFLPRPELKQLPLSFKNASEATENASETIETSIEATKTSTVAIEAITEANEINVETFTNFKTEANNTSELPIQSITILENKLTSEEEIATTETNNLFNNTFPPEFKAKAANLLNRLKEQLIKLRQIEATENNGENKKNTIDERTEELLYQVDQQVSNIFEQNLETLTPSFKAKLANLLNRLKEQLFRFREFQQRQQIIFELKNNSNKIETKISETNNTTLINQNEHLSTLNFNSSEQTEEKSENYFAFVTEPVVTENIKTLEEELNLEKNLTNTIETSTKTVFTTTTTTASILININSSLNNNKSIKLINNNKKEFKLNDNNYRLLFPISNNDFSVDSKTVQKVKEKEEKINNFEKEMSEDSQIKRIILLEAPSKHTTVSNDLLLTSTTSTTYENTKIKNTEKTEIQTSTINTTTSEKYKSTIPQSTILKEEHKTTENTAPYATSLVERLNQARRLREEQIKLEMMEAVRQEQLGINEPDPQLTERRKEIEQRLLQLAHAERFHRAMLERQKMEQQLEKQNLNENEREKVQSTKDNSINERVPRLWVETNCQLAKKHFPNASCERIEKLLNEFSLIYLYITSLFFVFRSYFIHSVVFQTIKLVNKFKLQYFTSALKKVVNLSVDPMGGN
ncbi:hypothetical protein Mgra_00006417 [Meloidogyne graminicola]|uniref:aECM cysteine-cradle domain-containing protein n=1 Tax=Meloidogyne graminicola TaxID=189291 RepID=A0A8S9ZLQ9_9BILA|nr:hypothetical protein Mgra_00006417 [Meloidogyne graminicola]